MKKVMMILIVLLFLAGCSDDDGSTGTLGQTPASRLEEGSQTRRPSEDGDQTPEPTTPAPTAVEEPSPTETLAPPTQTPRMTSVPPSPTAPLPTTSPPPAFSGQPLTKAKGELFSGSGTCTFCHSGLTDANGQDVSMDAQWRSTMMANAARDPYWQASVRAEVLEHPELRSVIEESCATCHMPMGRTTLTAADAQVGILEEGMLSNDHEYHELGMDGVSCTLCHQIEADNLGEASSFSGGYQVDTDRPAGDRLNYGPFPVSVEDAETMQSAVGFIPTESEHVKKSALCATCHTLFTPTLNEEGEITGQFPEQMPFVEWSHSEFRESQSCQDCHMPAANGPVVISSTSEQGRSPFHQHQFAGGNATMLRMLRTFGEEMGLTASSDQLEATYFRIVNQLQENTAHLEIVEASFDNGLLSFDVSVISDTGHKFPTGFPSRRAWLHVTILDADGEVVFESGAWNPDGSIRDNDNDIDPQRFEPHYEIINKADQVQIYEAQLVDSEGHVTTALLRGAGYAKDNRLLPRGFDKDTAPVEIGVYGLAMEDPDYGGGGDRIGYIIEPAGRDGPFSISVELLYQSISYRWARNLIDTHSSGDAPEINAFGEVYDGITNDPVVISSVDWETGTPGFADGNGQLSGSGQGGDAHLITLTLSYDALASGMQVRPVPEEPFMMVDSEIIPEHMEYKLVGYRQGDTVHEATIWVYPLERFSEGNYLAAPKIARLQDLIAEKPAVIETAPFADSLPMLPLFNAGQMMDSQIRFLDFQNGSGLRFLTQLGQAYYPINNQSMFYTYQGISDDGGYIISAIFPVSHPELPADSTMPEDAQGFIDGFDEYISDVQDFLEGQDGASFDPDLRLLDALIESLEVTGPPAAE